MNFIDIHCDLGGARIGLEARGGTCIGSAHWRQLFFPKGRKGLERLCGMQVTSTICDLLVVQAPAHDTVGGYWDPNGNWVCMRDLANVVRGLLRQFNPTFVILTGRKGVLSDGHGTSFAELLIAFAQHGYDTNWVRVNLSHFGILQDSLRVVVIAQRREQNETSRLDGALADRLLASTLASISGRASLGPTKDLEKFVSDRRPRAGLPAPSDLDSFGSVGIAYDGYFKSGSLHLTRRTPAEFSLADVLGIPATDNSFRASSARFISRAGFKSLQIKEDGFAHSVGPSISAWPLLAFSNEELARVRVPESFYNWHCTASGFVVFRITPARTLLLFGKSAAALGTKMQLADYSVSDQYKTIAATVSPVLLSHFFDTILCMKQGTNDTAAETA